MLRGLLLYHADLTVLTNTQNSIIIMLKLTPVYSLKSPRKKRKEKKKRKKKKRKG